METEMCYILYTSALQWKFIYVKSDKFTKQGHTNPELILHESTSTVNWGQMNNQQIAQINNFLEFLWVTTSASTSKIHTRI